MRHPATKKRSREIVAAIPVAIPVKAEEEGDGVADSPFSTPTGTTKRAHPIGFAPSVPMAVKSEASSKGAVARVQKLSS